MDERPVSEAGGGSAVRPMLAVDREGFVARHGLWDDAKHAAAAQLRRVVDELGVERVRIGFADQHGVVHGKTVTREALPAALRSGITVPSSLLIKDTSGRTVPPVFTADPGLGVGGFAGVGDVVLVADPTTFRVLPWSRDTGWLLCDVHFPDGRRVPFCTRGLLRDELRRLAATGLELTVGVELEFHVFGEPGADGVPTPLTGGGQLLHEEGLDRHDDLVRTLHRGLTDLDLPVRSLELEFGPSQFEVTLAARAAHRAADDVVLTRAAIRQLCRRAGLRATFMSRPAGSESASTGWHLHQSLRDGTGRAVMDEPGEVLSATGRRWLGGLLAHAAAGSVFATPTVNGYKRFRPHSLAPDRVGWGIDNRAAMIRVVPDRGEGARLENRAGEPAANPYLYIAAQVVAGRDGIATAADPGEPLDAPYSAPVAALPRSLGEALDALAADPVFERAWGSEVVRWFTTLKRAEYERYLAHVSDWEQREYFGLL
ncbi:MAG TPA: glutamine synthetase family protein [Pseudonocardia sp.]|uniref:glutamine synthetase family protein n=1 Tax=Pseudonocardia sp. TaxID=60912 RepID=UPI002B4B7576|nr:glutamine synthetase family protein [Pseudonocardia sp.]HLU54042.1 glutamine synthetase family protein [Pseudonocardia sp.]